MIQSFKCADTKALFEGQVVARFANMSTVATRKLQVLHSALLLMDLRVPLGNHLEALMGNRAGQHSIRVNDQWRLCFVWSPTGPAAVEIVDYH